MRATDPAASGWPVRRKRRVSFGRQPCADRNGSSELLSAQTRWCNRLKPDEPSGWNGFSVVREIGFRPGRKYGSDRCVAFPDRVLRDGICRWDGLEASRACCLRTTSLTGIQDRKAEASMAPVRVPSPVSEGNCRATAARPWFACANHGRQGQRPSSEDLRSGRTKGGGGNRGPSGLRSPCRSEVRFTPVGGSD